MLGIEPRTSYMLSMRSTTELHPHLLNSLFSFCRFTNTINPAVGTLQDRKWKSLLKFAWNAVNKAWRCWGLNPGTSYMRSMRFYHWATSPINHSFLCFCRFTKTIIQLWELYRTEVKLFCLNLLESHKQCLEMLGIEPGPHTCKACALPLSYIPVL